MPKVRYRAEFAGLTVAVSRARTAPPSPSPARGVLLGNEEGFRIDGLIEDPTWGAGPPPSAWTNERGDLEVDLATPPPASISDDCARCPTSLTSSGSRSRSSKGTRRREVRVRFNVKRIKVPVQGRTDVTRADLTVPSIALPLKGTSGHAVIEDGLITLRHVTGAAAGGRVAGLADLDFRLPQPTLRFDVLGDGLRLRQLPPTWGLPTGLIDGRVRGAADVTVTLHPCGPQTTGNGSARIEGATLLGFPTRQPIELELRGDGSRINVEPLHPL